MASIHEYCEMLSTSQLRALLREEYEGRGRLTTEVILLICGILAQRDPQLPPLEETIRSVCRPYLEE